MSWRDQIARRLIGQRGVQPNTAAQHEINAIGNAEQMFNKVQGDRSLAAQRVQQDIDWYRGLPSYPSVNPRNVERLEDTLGVLRSDEPLDAWWKHQ